MSVRRIGDELDEMCLVVGDIVGGVLGRVVHEIVQNLFCRGEIDAAWNVSAGLGHDHHERHACLRQAFFEARVDLGYELGDRNRLQSGRGAVVFDTGVGQNVLDEIVESPADDEMIGMRL